MVPKPGSAGKTTRAAVVPSRATEWSAARLLHVLSQPDEDRAATAREFDFALANPKPFGGSWRSAGFHAAAGRPVCVGCEVPDELVVEVGSLQEAHVID